jgi:hypothetical protein
MLYLVTILVLNRDILASVFCFVPVSEQNAPYPLLSLADNQEDKLKKSAEPSSARRTFG